MKYIIGKKIRMTQVWNQKGDKVAVTVVRAEPNIATQLKTMDKDGYSAVQLGIGTGKKMTKPLAGHLTGLRSVRALREVRLNTRHGTRELSVMERGLELTVDQFEQGDAVVVKSKSKGKGFQGVVRKYGFHGHPKSHGHKDQERMPGSIGSGGVQKVFKGKRMAGRMGGISVTTKRLSIVEVHPETNELYVKGAIPGSRGASVEIMSE